jgi:hypothetical protein
MAKNSKPDLGDRIIHKEPAFNRENEGEVVQMLAMQFVYKTDDGINWDLIQRMRFMNADAEIDPEDSYSKGTQKFNEGNNT